MVVTFGGLRLRSTHKGTGIYPKDFARFFTPFFSCFGDLLVTDETLDLGQVLLCIESKRVHRLVELLPKSGILGEGDCLAGNRATWWQTACCCSTLSKSRNQYNRYVTASTTKRTQETEGATKHHPNGGYPNPIREIKQEQL